MRTDFGYFEEKQLGKPYDLKLLARLYPYTQRYKLLLAASIVLVVFITLLDLSLPYVTKIAIDRYIVPKMESTGGKEEGPVEGGIRYQKADLTDPGIRAVVEKHPRLFKIHGNWAMIPYDDLTKLSKKDLGTLRKKDLAGVTWITAVFLAIVLMHFVFNMAQVLIMEYTGQMIMHDLRVRLFRGFRFHFLPAIRWAVWSPGWPMMFRTCTSCSPPLSFSCSRIFFSWWGLR